MGEDGLATPRTQPDVQVEELGRTVENVTQRGPQCLEPLLAPRILLARACLLLGVEDDQDEYLGRSAWLRMTVVLTRPESGCSIARSCSNTLSNSASRSGFVLTFCSCAHMSWTLPSSDDAILEDRPESRQPLGRFLRRAQRPWPGWCCRVGAPPVRRRGSSLGGVMVLGYGLASRADSGVPPGPVQLGHQAVADDRDGDPGEDEGSCAKNQPRTTEAARLLTCGFVGATWCARGG